MSILEKIIRSKKNRQENRFIELNKTYFKVKNHWFWDEYDKFGWEPQTYNILRKFFQPDMAYVDIGAWVGLTIFYAAEIGYKDIYAIEANPISYEIVKENCSYNKLTENANISNVCVHNVDDTMVNFGGKIDLDTSSASSIRGNDWKIPSTKLCTYLNRQNLLNRALTIKIDIEGAEELIMPDLQQLTDKNILLSLHPPFFSDKKITAQKIVNVCKNFNYVYDSSMEILPLERLFNMIISTEKHPEWGTPHGNFFEIALTCKKL